MAIGEQASFQDETTISRSSETIGLEGAEMILMGSWAHIDVRGRSATLAASINCLEMGSMGDCEGSKESSRQELEAQKAR